MDAPAEYRTQVTAEQYNEGKGEWETRPGRRHNHATDCECIADVVARIAGVNRPLMNPAKG
jgi:phage terminase large subunit GpA-like protein